MTLKRHKVRPCVQCNKPTSTHSGRCFECEKKYAIALRFINHKNNGNCVVCGEPIPESWSRSLYCSIECSVFANNAGKAVRAAVTKALKSGLLQKIMPETKCVDCGKPAKCYDHRNYLKPLDVGPVCVGCNVKRRAAEDLHVIYQAAQNDRIRTAAMKHRVQRP